MKNVGKNIEANIMVVNDKLFKPIWSSTSRRIYIHINLGTASKVFELTRDIVNVNL